MVLQARAKLNLTLKILGRRPDGYHDIESVVQSVDLCDRITLRTCSPVYAGRSGQEIDIKVTCNDTSIPTGRGNLAVEAVLALANFVGLRASAETDACPPASVEMEADPRASVEMDADPGVSVETDACPRASVEIEADPRASVEIDMEKRIPVAAGLGGGSADAAAVLIGLNHLWRLGLGERELMAVGESLGADIPFCVTGGTGVIRGKGERIELLPTPDDLWFVVVTLPERVSTAQAYTTFDQLTETTGAYDAGSYDLAVDATDVTSGMVRALRAGEVQDIAGRLTNDLEYSAVSIVPQIARAKEALLAAGAVGVGMSGSGPTVFGIADSREKAETICDTLRLTSSGGALEQVSSYDVPKLSSSGGTPKQASSACAKEQASSGGTFAIGAFKEVFVCRAVSQGVAYARVPDAGAGH